MGKPFAKEVKGFFFVTNCNIDLESVRKDIDTSKGYRIILIKHS
jgi:hypothetical protein